MSKKELSYAYWHNQGGGDAPLVEPQRLTEEQLASLPVSRPVGQASVWNSAGTWEERNWTAWAQERLKALVADLSVPLSVGGELSVSGVSSISGDATVMTVRGRPRHGFDFTLTLGWRAWLGGDEAREVKGSLQLPDASRDACQEESELEVEFKPDSKTIKKANATLKEEAALAEAAKALRKPLFAALRQLDADMLARMEQGQTAAPSGS